MSTRTTSRVEVEWRTPLHLDDDQMSALYDILCGFVNEDSKFYGQLVAGEDVSDPKYVDEILKEITRMGFSGVYYA